jgi:hypothetical protein
MASEDRSREMAMTETGQEGAQGLLDIRNAIL